MSLYIHQENQKLLWESMQQIPMFQDYGKNNEGKKESWFRAIIEQFYESNKFKLLNMDELQQLNRDTVAYMIGDLKKQITQESQSSYQGYSASFSEMSPLNEPKQLMPYTSLPPENRDVTRNAILEKKQEQLNSQFSMLQQEYGNMLKSGPDHEIDFSANNGEDKPIENIEKLMEDTIKQREYDLKSPPNPNNDLNVIDLASPDYNAPKKLIRSEKFPYKDVTESPPKNVSWNNQLINEPVKHRPPQYSKTSDNMHIFKDFMEDIRDTLFSMRNEINTLKHSQYNSNQNTSFEENHKKSNINNQNPLVNNILGRMKRKPNVPQQITYELQDVTNEF
jgi:hypothetical protein